MKPNLIPNARDTQRRSRRVYTVPARIALALLVVATVVYFQAPGAALLSSVWGRVSPTTQDLLTMASIIAALVTAVTISLYVSKRIYLARKSTPLASVAVIGGGGYGDFMRRATQAFPRRVRDHLLQGYVLTNDSLRGSQGKPGKSKKYEFNTRVYHVPHGEGGNGSRAIHEALGPQYVQHMKPVIDAADRVYLVVSRGGGTGTGVAMAMTRQAMGRPTSVIVTGKSPAALLQAVADPNYACKARAFAARQLEAAAKLGWTNGKPALVEVTA